MKLYANSIHATNESQPLNSTLRKIEFLGLHCVKENVYFFEQLLKNEEKLPKLRMTIGLPEWDKITHSSDTAQHLAPYHHLQNCIRDNQKAWLITHSKGARRAILSFSEVLTLTKLRRSPELFVGDHRQFALMAPDNPDAWIYFDRYMATRITPYLEANSLDKKDFSTFLALLQIWAVNHGMLPSYAAALFANAQRFTPDNARALGQLFNSMDSQQQGPVGTRRWINIVNTIWTTFGAEHFFAWKSCVLDTSQHWLDCVEAADRKHAQSAASPLRTQAIQPSHFQHSWLQLINAYSQQPLILRNNPALLYFVQTLLTPEFRIPMFGENNNDLKRFFAQLPSAPQAWLEFFQDPNVPITAGLIPCAWWATILADPKNRLRTLEHLPSFFELFHNVNEIELCAFGMAVLVTQIKANASDQQIHSTLVATVQAIIAYQRFIQNREPLNWQSLLYAENVEWSTAYFELLQCDQYREVAECIIEATQDANDLAEVQWMLSLGKKIVRSTKAQDSKFLIWISNAIQIEDLKKTQAFMNALFPNKNGIGFDLTLHSLQHLWQLWCQNNVSSQRYLLYLAQTTLDLPRLKNQHEFQNYMSQPPQRQSLMQALGQGFLALGTKLTQHCYQWYRASLDQITQWVDWGNLALGHREGLYHQAYQILNTLIHEIQMASSRSPTSTQAPLTQALQTHYADLFSAQEKAYAGFFWSCNRARINQAQDLFQQLKAVRTTNKLDYYTQILTIILQQQITIFTADQKYILYAPNQKGHSRLHDICTELFLTVSRDCLCDPDLSESDKSFVQPLLRKQIEQHVTLLSQQIANPLSQTLHDWHAKQESLETLHKILSSQQQTNIPAKHQYLYRSLVTMMTLPEMDNSNPIQLAVKSY